VSERDRSVEIEEYLENEWVEGWEIENFDSVMWLKLVVLVNYGDS
jgi:hypothetical protein